MSNSLLDDLKDEAYDFALASGNLLPKPREAPERFTSAGYRASYSHTTCACGHAWFSLVNIMHLETGDKGSSKAVALHLGSSPNLSFSPDSAKTVSIMSGKTAYCPECLPVLGFPLGENHGRG